jgi:tetratricopeptide (TPR) repeat protein
VTVFANSATLWSRVLEICPSSSLAHSNLGDHFREEGRIREAAAHYDADLAERPYYESSLLGRALLHEQAGETREARRLYQKALEKRPDSAAARVQYADFLDWIKEPENGLAVLTGLDPKRATGTVYQKMFDLYRELGRPDEAFASARRAVDLAPYDPGSWIRLALAAEDEGKLDLALSATRRAQEFAPGSPIPKEILDRILRRVQKDG